MRDPTPRGLLCQLLSANPLPSIGFVVAVVWWLSRVPLFATPWTTLCQASLSFTISRSLLKFMYLSQWCYLTISYTLLPPSLFVFNLSQHQGLFQWVSSSHHMAKVLELQQQSFPINPMNIQDWFPSGWTGLISLLFKGPSRVFSSTTVWKHQGTDGH